LKTRGMLSAMMALALALACTFVLPARAEEPAKVAGKWELSWQGSQGPITATVDFKQNGENLEGTFTRNSTEGTVGGTVKGKAIDFTVTLETPNAKIKVHYTGQVDGDTMKGTVPYGQSTREWTAKRAK